MTDNLPMTHATNDKQQSSQPDFEFVKTESEKLADVASYEKDLCSTDTVYGQKPEKNSSSHRLD